ncbi:MAG: DUF1624 domain-containing protein [DPANN group archaeon]|nr:DUF1624 domain-containing protein [DPANN group archaeon]
MHKRFYEIDVLRGIAIILMILYHMAYDLNYFARFSLNVHSGTLLVIGRLSAITFIFLVGVSLTISLSRTQKKLSKIDIYKKYIKRGLNIFSFGLIITLITYIFLESGTIYFGILHFIGISIILAYPFLKYKKLNLVLSMFVIALGFQIEQYTINSLYLLPLGIRPTVFYSLDYFPLFPWFGLILFGIFIGNNIYKDGKRQFKLKDYSEYLQPLSFIGQKSLLIYLLHQPILIGLIYLVQYFLTNIF